MVKGLEKQAKLGIICLILEASSTDAYDTKKTTKIMYNTLLNNPKLKDYWAALTEVGLLKYEISTQTFKTTEKGLRFLGTLSELDQREREEEQEKKNKRRRQTITTIAQRFRGSERDLNA